MSPRNRGITAGAAALAALFVLYVALRPLVCHVSDSYSWVNTVEENDFSLFFHPHHVLYLTAAWWWAKAVKLIVPPVSTWAALSAMSAVFGCAGVAAAYSTLRVAGAEWRAAAAGALLVAFSFGYWFFSSEPEVYAISTACALWSFYFMARLALEGRIVLALRAGLAAGFAALFHQTGIFLFAPLIVIMAASTAPRGTRIVAAALFTAGFGMVVAPVYLVAAWAVLPDFTPAAFVGWLFHFAGKGFGGWSIGGIIHAPLGFARGFVGGLMALDAARGMGAGPMLWVGLAVAAGAIAALAGITLKAVLSVRAMAREAKILFAALLSAFGVYAAFSVYFDSGNFEWWTIPAAFLSVALAVAALTGRRPATRLAIAAVVLVFAANLILDFTYRRRADSDFVLNAARRVVRQTTPDDVIVAPSYLGVRVWFENRDRMVFCPDEARRTMTADAMKRELADMAERSMGRVVIAGADLDPGSRRYTEELFDDVPASGFRAVGAMVFLNGSRGLVMEVGPVQIKAIDASAYLSARSLAPATARDEVRR